MSSLTSALYKTNKSIVQACEELGIKFEPEDLEDAEQCSLCNIWYYSYELIVDYDGLNTCKFCTSYYS